MFGVSGAKRLGLLIEASDRFLLSNRSAHLKNCLHRFIDEQVVDCVDALYVATYGSEVSGLWTKPRCVTDHVLRDLKQWLLGGLEPCGGSNLMAGLKHVSIELSYHLMTTNTCPFCISDAGSSPSTSPARGSYHHWH